MRSSTRLASLHALALLAGSLVLAGCAQTDPTRGELNSLNNRARALNAARDPQPEPEPPAPSGARLSIVRELPGELRALHQDARADADAYEDAPPDEPIPLFGYEGSIEAANRDAALHADACALDLYDLHDDGREPW